MEQLKIFAFGVLRILVIMALYITCISTFVSGDGLFIVAGIISLIAISWEVYLIFKKDKGGK